METKYLSDGRKVAVVGKLNNIESIVQEIFITNEGDEIPSGEKFTSKSLHDKPVISYAEKRAKECESRLGEAEERLNKCKREEREVKERLKASSAFLDAFLKTQKSFCLTEKLTDLFSFVSGEIEWIVEVDYCGASDPIRFDEAFKYYENSHGEKTFDGINLVSLFGKSNGDLEYRKNRYSDGSGSYGKNLFIPFKTRLEAIEFIASHYNEKYDNGKLSVANLRQLKKLNVEVKTAIIDEVKAIELAKKNESLSIFVEKNKKEEERRLSEIKEIEKFWTI